MTNDDQPKNFDLGKDHIVIDPVKTVEPLHENEDDWSVDADPEDEDETSDTSEMFFGVLLVCAGLFANNNWSLWPIIIGALMIISAIDD